MFLVPSFVSCPAIWCLISCPVPQALSCPVFCPVLCEYSVSSCSPVPCPLTSPALNPVPCSLPCQVQYSVLCLLSCFLIFLVHALGPAFLRSGGLGCGVLSSLLLYSHTPCSCLGTCVFAGWGVGVWGLVLWFHGLIVFISQSTCSLLLFLFLAHVSSPICSLSLSVLLPQVCTLPSTLPLMFVFFQLFLFPLFANLWPL